MRVIYPFTAIVGQKRMRRALILNAIDTRIGGVLIRGERGTGKSTAARALAALLPPVEVVQGCRFGCDPHKHITWCTECRERFAETEDPPIETRQPFKKENGISNLVCLPLLIVGCCILMKSTCLMTMLWTSCLIPPPWV